MHSLYSAGFCLDNGIYFSERSVIDQQGTPSFYLVRTPEMSLAPLSSPPRRTQIDCPDIYADRRGRSCLPIAGGWKLVAPDAERSRTGDTAGAVSPDNNQKASHPLLETLTSPSGGVGVSGGERGIARLFLSLTLRAPRSGPAYGSPKSFPTIRSNPFSFYRGFSSPP